MSYDVKLPDIGEGVAEGEIVRWLVKAGDTVREDQPLVEVMTDKASVEIPSPRAGVIASLHAAEGQVVPVGTVIISIAVAGEGAAPAGARAQAAPAVRALAKELGVALEAVGGSGPGGSITADDVRRAAGGAKPGAAPAGETRVPL